MGARRVIFVNRFYWPDVPATAQLLTDLAEALAAKSIAVTVITTGTPDTPAAESHRGVAIARLSQRKAHQASLWQRTRHFNRFRCAVRRWLEANLQADDIVVCLTDPPMIATAVAKVATRKGARVIHWIQDVFPEIAANVFGVSLLNVLRGPRDRAWRAANLCVTPGDAMREFVVQRGVAASRVLAIPNWAPAGLAPASKDTVAEWKAKHGLTDRFVVMYSGNLGRAHDFAWAAPLAARFRGDPRFAFVFVGTGPRLPEVQKAVREAGLSNVYYFSSAPRSDLATVLSAGDVHLVSIRQGCENLVFPSKLAGISAVGRPAIVIGPAHNEPARIVQTGDWGRGFAPSDIDGMSQILRHWSQNFVELERLDAKALTASTQSRFELALSAWERILTSDGDSPHAVKTSLAAS